MGRLKPHRMRWLTPSYLVHLLHKAAEVGGRAPERRRQAPGGERRAEDVEQGGVFEGKAPGQPGIASIVDDEPALQARGAPGAAREQRGGLPQLVGIGHVLGVVDHEMLAARQGQGGVERPRLRPRQARRHHDDLEMGGQGDAREGLSGGGIVGFDQELEIELGDRVVAVLCSKLTQKR